ncbi:MAG: C-GCAxxG-C-C family protein [Candidatus Kariarchaeaceae archaeon]
MSQLIDLTLKYWETENCARAAACGLLDFFNHISESKTMFKAILPFGGGIGERSICGAVCGSLAALSFKLAELGLEKEAINEKVSLFKEQFTTRFETLICRDLIQPYLLEDGTFAPERRDRCTEFVVEGVKMVNSIVEEFQI